MHKSKETVFFERGDTKDRNNGFNVLLAVSVVVFSGCFLKEVLSNGDRIYFKASQDIKKLLIRHTQVT